MRVDIFNAEMSLLMWLEAFSRRKKLNQLFFSNNLYHILNHGKMKLKLTDVNTCHLKCFLHLQSMEIYFWFFKMSMILRKTNTASLLSILPSNRKVILFWEFCLAQMVWWESKELMTLEISPLLFLSGKVNSCSVNSYLL